MQPCKREDNSSTGWLAGLSLELEQRSGKSVIARSSQDGPLTLQQPFYPEGSDLCHMYLLHPPAGVVGGDRLEFNVQLTQNARALITTPGATKFYRSNGKQASQCQHFHIQKGCSLEWLPQETIYFPDTNARLQSRIELEADATFIGWEIHCLGLPVNKIGLEDGNVRTGWQIYRDEQPLLLESFRTGPELATFAAASLRGLPVFGTFLCNGATQELVDTLRETLSKATRGDIGITLLADLLVIRYLGESTNEAKSIFLAGWQTVRPEILGRKGCEPRIWAT